jgi:cytochrome c oxidase subunit 2
MGDISVGKWWSFLFAVMMIFCGGTFFVAPFFGWWLPEGVSTHAHLVDYLFYFILLITGFFFVLTEAILCVFMAKYSGDRDKTQAPPPPNPVMKMFKPVTMLLNDQHKVEMAWTIVPAALLLYIAVAQVETWADVKYVSRMPQAGATGTPLQVALSARQFEWRVRYPSFARTKTFLADKDAATALGTYKSFAKYEEVDDIKPHVPNELHVIKGTPAVVHLSTMDVIHSFNLPHLRVKQDALPGKLIPVWFTPIKSNTIWDDDRKQYVDGINPETRLPDDHYIWDIPCAELCGWGHFRMVGRLFVHDTKEDFLKWLELEEGRANSHK